MPISQKPHLYQIIGRKDGDDTVIDSPKGIRLVLPDGSEIELYYSRDHEKVYVYGSDSLVVLPHSTNKIELRVGRNGR